MDRNDSSELQNPILLRFVVRKERAPVIDKALRWAMNQLPSDTPVWEIPAAALTLLAEIFNRRLEEDEQVGGEVK
jgi:hypothetical protein